MNGDELKRYNIANYIASGDTVPVVTRDETFGTALSFVSNSHTVKYPIL